MCNIYSILRNVKEQVLKYQELYMKTNIITYINYIFIYTHAYMFIMDACNMCLWVYV